MTTHAHSFRDAWSFGGGVSTRAGGHRDSAPLPWWVGRENGAATAHTPRWAVRESPHSTACEGVSPPPHGWWWWWWWWRVRWDKAPDCVAAAPSTTPPVSGVGMPPLHPSFSRAVPQAKVWEGKKATRQKEWSVDPKKKKKTTTTMRWHRVEREEESGSHTAPNATTTAVESVRPTFPFGWLPWRWWWRWPPPPLQWRHRLRLEKKKRSGRRRRWWWW